MYKTVFLLLIPLSLSAFTHLWNPIGFPDLNYDEGVYIRRALNILNGLSPQESSTYYDHPYFGQLFLAGIFKIFSFPKSIGSSMDINSMEALYTLPRVLMGTLAVIDTLLIYKISERRYSQNVAFLASILFAVMPMTWFVRRTLLDSIMLPFILASIYFAIYSKYGSGPKIINEQTNVRFTKRKVGPVILSGIMLGLANFTKVPAIITIPLVAYVIFSTNKNWKILGLWFVPVILLPLIWPLYSLSVHEFSYWLDGVFTQSNRHFTQAHQQIKPPLNTIYTLLKIDPILMVLGFAGIIFAVIRRDFFILLWAIPNLIFHYLLGYYPVRESISLLPVFCIAAAIPIIEVLNRIKSKSNTIAKFAVISTIGIFGLISTTLLITANITSPQFQTAAFVSGYLKAEDNKNAGVTLYSTPIYSWIFKYVYNGSNVSSQEYRNILNQGLKTGKILLIADQAFDYGKENEKLGTLYNDTSAIAGFNGTRKNYDTREYPYTSMSQNNEGVREIEVRVSNNRNLSEKATSCIKYDKHSITVLCNSADLSDVSNELNNSKLLREISPKIWILNANLTIASGSSFYINNKDTNWLKINSTSGVAQYIKSQGNMIVDSVKITGWDSIKNDYGTTDKNGTIPRSYIINDGEGTVKLANSEVANLGYNDDNGSGLTYVKGTGSTIKNNTIHDVWGGIYFNGNIDNVTIEDNEFYRNGDSGIDLSDKAHGFRIINNNVHDNGMNGIICSTGCENVLIESNTIYNNKQGVTLNKNASGSTVTNNTIYNNTHQVVIGSLSNNNKLSKNSIGGGNSGIKVTGGSSKNLITENDIENSTNGIYVAQGASGNLFGSNKIVNATYAAIYVKDNVTQNNIFKDNVLIDSQKNDISRANLETGRQLFINNTVASSRHVVE